MSVDQMSLFTALLALVAAAVALVGILLLTTAAGRAVLAGFRTDARRLAFSMAGVSTAASLWFSEVGGFIPCELCWYQRILMYPLVLVLGAAVWGRDDLLRWRVLPFSLLGVAVSGYHVQLQWFPDQASSCEMATPCTQQWVDEFGFVSIPVMAFFGFAAITVLVLAATVREDAGLPDGLRAGRDVDSITPGEGP
jgi:disulfide bond formation protein DsbB